MHDCIMHIGTRDTSSYHIIDKGILKILCVDIMARQTCYIYTYI